MVLPRKIERKQDVSRWDVNGWDGGGMTRMRHDWYGHGTISRMRGIINQGRGSDVDG